MSAPDDSEAAGPAFSRLNGRQRKFVEILVGPGGPPHGSGRTSWAARGAGYGREDSTDHTLGAIAGRLVTQPEVRAAIAEALQSQIHILAPQALDALRSLVVNKNPQQARAIESVLNRIVPQAAPVVNVKLEYTPPSERATAAVLARIASLAAQAGVKSLPQPVDVVDAEFTEARPADE
jgi:phage terminase small subunit